MSTCPEVYSKESLQQLVHTRMRVDRGVQVVGELEGPGHSGARRRSVPSFHGTGNTGFRGGGVVNAASDQFYSDYLTIMKEMAAVFNNTKYFHIGCDEASVHSL